MQAHCGEFADKYVEYELILICIDLLLLKLPVYRHCLFNLPASNVRVSGTTQAEIHLHVYRLRSLMVSFSLLVLFSAR
jgi:hypothetical protein